MALETGDLYALTATAYRNGVLDKLFPLTGEALDGVMLETGASLGDLTGMMDEAEPETLEKMDATMGKLSTLVRLMNSDRLMSLVSRILDFEPVRRVTVWAIRKYLTNAAVKSQRKKAADFQRNMGFPYPYADDRIER